MGRSAHPSTNATHHKALRVAGHVLDFLQCRLPLRRRMISSCLARLSCEQLLVLPYLQACY